ncbi:sigma-54-dependent transcriptional regulator [Singulisphaera sp. PoT]|uniref:sigma-54-dependent transcriptional regulator n=1 Tax=Singulisphaera sp. PoT TaxID=3411797 RepID=UPI003BF5F55D
MLMSLGQEIDEAANDRAAVRLMERGGIDLLIAGVDPTDMEGLELLAYMKRKHKEVPVILLFPGAYPEQTVEAIRQGASSVLKYPVSATELRAAVVQALGLRITIPASPVPASATNGVAVEGGEGGRHFEPAMFGLGDDGNARSWGIIGTDPSLLHILKASASIAQTRDPVLILGEHGTGKQLLARTIHNLSPRAASPFVSLECVSALSNGYIGHHNPDGSQATTAGTPLGSWLAKLNEAQGGTLLLNRIGDLPPELEPHLLRILQEHENTKDLTKKTQTNVRIIMASDESGLAGHDQAKRAQELYQRISAVCFKLPSLRHRNTDIEALAEFFRESAAQELGKSVVGFTRDALDALGKYQWPGNIGELKAVIQRGVQLCQGSRITSGHLSPGPGGFLDSKAGGSSRSRNSANIRPLKEALEEPEKRIIIQALQALNWNRQETARVLDINRTTLYKKMKKYGLLVDGPIWVN